MPAGIISVLSTIFDGALVAGFLGELYLLIDGFISGGTYDKLNRNAPIEENAKIVWSWAMENKAKFAILFGTMLAFLVKKKCFGKEGRWGKSLSAWAASIGLINGLDEMDLGKDNIARVEGFVSFYDQMGDADGPETAYGQSVESLDSNVALQKRTFSDIELLSAIFGSPDTAERVMMAIRRLDPISFKQYKEFYS